MSESLDKYEDQRKIRKAKLRYGEFQRFTCV